jgi:hypothetical protein
MTSIKSEIPGDTDNKHDIIDCRGKDTHHAKTGIDRSSGMSEIYAQINPVIFSQQYALPIFTINTLKDTSRASQVPFGWSCLKQFVFRGS